MLDIETLLKQLDGSSGKHHEAYLKSLFGRMATWPERKRHVHRNIDENIAKIKGLGAELSAANKLTKSSYGEWKKLRAEFDANHAVWDDETFKVGAVKCIAWAEFSDNSYEKASQIKKKYDELVLS